MSTLSYIAIRVIPILSTQFVLNSILLYHLHREIPTSILYFPFGLIDLSRHFSFTLSYSHITLFHIQFSLNTTTTNNNQHTKTLTNIHHLKSFTHVPWPTYHDPQIIHPNTMTHIIGQLSQDNYPRTTIPGHTYRYIYTTYKRITQTIFNRATKGKRDQWWYSHVQRRTTVGVFKFAK